jgi:hypothetical protein
MKAMQNTHHLRKAQRNKLVLVLEKVLIQSKSSFEFGEKFLSIAKTKLNDHFLITQRTAGYISVHCTKSMLITFCLRMM